MVDTENSLVLNIDHHHPTSLFHENHKSCQQQLREREDYQRSLSHIKTPSLIPLLSWRKIDTISIPYILPHVFDLLTTSTASFMWHPPTQQDLNHQDSHPKSPVPKFLHKKPTTMGTSLSKQPADPTKQPPPTPADPIKRDDKKPYSTSKTQFSDDDLLKYTGRSRDELKTWMEDAPGVGKNQNAGKIGMGPGTGGAATVGGDG
jgi:hypothetical protein